MDMADTIHHFKLLKPDGRIFDSKKYQGGSVLLLVFFKGAWCNYCKRQLLDLSNNYDKFKELDVKIAAVSKDTQLNTSILSALISDKFPLLSDESGNILLKHETDHQGRPLPSVRMFDKSGEQCFSWQAYSHEDRISAAELLNKIKNVILAEK